MDWKEIKRVLSADGKHYMSIMAAPGNLFRFQEHSYVTEDDDTFWSPTHGSGLYDSAEAAERNARLELRWLRDRKSD
jgi:hypothetical protein